jgi:hypothetical protein
MPERGRVVRMALFPVAGDANEFLAALGGSARFARPSHRHAAALGHAYRLIGRHRCKFRRKLLNLRFVGQSRSDVLRTRLQEGVLPQTLRLASKIDRVNDGRFWPDKPGLQEQARQLDAKRAIDPPMLTGGCNERLHASITVGRQAEAMKSVIALA